MDVAQRVKLLGCSRRNNNCKRGWRFCRFFEENNNSDLKRNIIATNSIIHNELRELIVKKDIE